METFSRQSCGFVLDTLVSAVEVLCGEEKIENADQSDVLDKSEEAALRALSQMAGAFWEHSEARKSVQDFLMAWDSDTENEKKYWLLVRAVVKAEIKSGIPLDLYIIWDDHLGKRENMPSYFRRLFANTNPLLLDMKIWQIGMRRGAVLEERIREIPFGQWQKYVIDFISGSTIPTIKQMNETMIYIYMGFLDEYYAFYLQHTNQVLAMATDAVRQEEANRKNAAEADEMQILIDRLQQKVEELISAGMMDEAEMVMKEIEKYVPVVAGNDMV